MLLPWRSIRSSFDQPDALEWTHEKDYSTAVAAQIGRALGFIQSSTGRLDVYEQAFSCASSCLSERMSRRQRAQSYYAIALAYTGVGVFSMAIYYLDAALDLCEELPDGAAWAEATFLAGSIERARSNYRIGAEYLTRTITLLCELGTEDDPADTGLAVDAYTILATCLYALERYQEAWKQIEAARRLVRRPPGDVSRSALIEWLAAILYRWTGDSARALQQAIAASDAYAAFATSPSARMLLGRMQVTVADSALDLAEASDAGPESRGRTTYLRVAAPYVQRANSLARATQDLSGGGVAILVRARYERLMRKPSDRLSRIERVIQRAEQLHEADLMIQAQTVLGAELAAQNEIDAALTRYRLAVDIANRHETPVLGVWARHELAEAREPTR